MSNYKINILLDAFFSLLTINLIETVKQSEILITTTLQMIIAIYTIYKIKQEKK